MPGGRQPLKRYRTLYEQIILVTRKMGNTAFTDHEEEIGRGERKTKSLPLRSLSYEDIGVVSHPLAIKDRKSSS